MTNALEIFPSLVHISDRFNGLLLDAYGVFWGGNDCGLLPGSKGVMEKFVSSGKIVGILSNSTQLASKEINKLHSHGLIPGRHFHFLVTSGEVARHIFLNEKLPFEAPRHTYWLFGGMHPKFASHTAIFQDTPYSETEDIDGADFIYVSIPHINGEDQIDPELFRKALENIKPKNLPKVCPNPDAFAHEGKPPRAVVRQGSIAKMYEEMGGQVFYIGKPHNKAYSMALEQFHKHSMSDPMCILMVGDTPETDIRGARHFGMPSALVTKTGIMADRISNRGLEKALRELPTDDTPNYFIEQLKERSLLTCKEEKRLLISSLAT
jgi:HAD superfamily hydrolase (TIGR01459 family)